MLNKSTAAIVLLIGLFIVNTGFCQDLEDNWKDFLHYTVIGRPDLAKGYAQVILGSDPDPVELLNLSQETPQGYETLLKINQIASDQELVELAGRILEVIDRGSFARRSDPTLIVEAIEKLSGTERARMNALKRLGDAGEYAVPFMLDAMADPSRDSEFAYIAQALPNVGKDAIRPLTTALNSNNIRLQTQIIIALGEIKYPQSLPYLKYIIESGSSAELGRLASESIMQIDPAAVNMSAAELFFQLAENYYYHAESLSPAEDVATANVWFWDTESRELIHEAVAKDYFNELMAMRACEWALKADAGFGPAIGLWLASYFKAESMGVEEMPEYFDNHAEALVYATTAGVEYLHQALARAVRDGNAYVALGVVEALSTTAGENSLLYRIGQDQPLIQALSFNDRKVKYSAAIAIAAAGPKDTFNESRLVVANLADALTRGTQSNELNTLESEIADSYALRAATVMRDLAISRNTVISLSLAQSSLVRATADEQADIQMLAGQTLAYLSNPDAQRAIAEMAMNTGNSDEVRLSAFTSLAISAKINANMLPDEMINSIYSFISSDDTEQQLRSAAAAAYGALNLPSQKVKDLILDQAKT
ncbi:HEAT repeat domain-containing protein [Planctomycetota bacterium]